MTPWIDKIMKPFTCDPHWLPAHMYNRIHEAVGRGTEQQGIELVKTIVDAFEAAAKGPRQHQLHEAYDRGFADATDANGESDEVRICGDCRTPLREYEKLYCMGCRMGNYQACILCHEPVSVVCAECRRGLEGFKQKQVEVEKAGSE